MPPKRKTTKKQVGRGAIMDALRFIKDKKLLSTGLGMIPHPGAQAASALAGLVGLGRKKRAPRKKAPAKSRQVGRGIFGDLGGGIGSIFGGLGGGLGSVAHGLFGAGKKRRVAKKNVIHI